MLAFFERVPKRLSFYSNRLIKNAGTTMTSKTGSPQKKRRIAKLVITFLLLGIGLFVLVAGAYFAFMNQTATDKEGYVLSQPYRIQSGGAYAFILGVNAGNTSSANAVLKWVVTSTDPSKELFVGWAWSNDADNYLNGVTFEAPYPVYNWHYGLYSALLNITTTTIWSGSAPSVSPGQENFWLDSGTTNATIAIHYDHTWDSSTLGNKALVIMNVDGSRNIQADVQFGAKIIIYGWLPYVLIPAGVILFMIGIAIFRRKR
jgi:hypothetical protein